MSENTQIEIGLNEAYKKITHERECVSESYNNNALLKKNEKKSSAARKKFYKLLLFVDIYMKKYKDVKKELNMHTIYF